MFQVNRAKIGSFFSVSTFFTALLLFAYLYPFSVQIGMATFTETLHVYFYTVFQIYRNPLSQMLCPASCISMYFVSPVQRPMEQEKENKKKLKGSILLSKLKKYFFLHLVLGPLFS